jgi:hypothetical protein
MTFLENVRRTRTLADVARAAEKNSGRKGDAGNQVGARETRMGPIGLLVRLGLLFSVVLIAWSRGLFSNAALLGWHLPAALAHNWAVQVTHTHTRSLSLIMPYCLHVSRCLHQSASRCLTSVRTCLRYLCLRLSGVALKRTRLLCQQQDVS